MTALEPNHSLENDGLRTRVGFCGLFINASAMKPGFSRCKPSLLRRAQSKTLHRSFHHPWGCFWELWCRSAAIILPSLSRYTWWESTVRWESLVRVTHAHTEFLPRGTPSRTCREAGSNNTLPCSSTCNSDLLVICTSVSTSSFLAP